MLKCDLTDREKKSQIHMQHLVMIINLKSDMDCRTSSRCKTAHQQSEFRRPIQ